MLPVLPYIEMARELEINMCDTSFWLLDKRILVLFVNCTAVLGQKIVSHLCWFWFPFSTLLLLHIFLAQYSNSLSEHHPKILVVWDTYNIEYPRSMEATKWEVRLKTRHWLSECLQVRVLKVCMIGKAGGRVAWVCIYLSESDMGTKCAI